MVQVSSPIGQLTNDKVFADSGTAASAISGMYATATNTIAISTYATISTGCAADELLDFTSNYTAFYNNSIDPANSINQSLWLSYYKVIYQANAIIENIVGNANLNQQTIDQFAGEAKFMRAYCYFHLVNLYGNVPLVTRTNVTTNESFPRVPQDQIFNQIIADLKDAGNLLSSTYPTSEKVRANKSAALGLLSIAYLYKKDWVDAESTASSVINDPQYQLVTDLSMIFLKNSNEAILQFWAPNGFTSLGQALIPGAARPNLAFTPDFLASSDSGDARIISWTKEATYQGTNYSCPFKYKNNKTITGTHAEYSMILRLAEIYLVRAEARAWQNNLDGASVDLNMIRTRASLDSLHPNDQSSMLSFIEKERRIELAAENGRRWYDLKRIGQADAILGSLKPHWITTDALFPIPATELSANPFLIQNPGY